MLRKELKDADIPHQTTIRKRVEEVLSKHLDQLERQMAVSQLTYITLEFDIHSSLRNLWERFPILWICGQILIFRHLWP